MIALPSWLDAFFGPAIVRYLGVLFPQRAILEVVGDGVTVEDAGDAIRLTFTGEALALEGPTITGSVIYEGVHGQGRVIESVVEMQSGSTSYVTLETSSASASFAMEDETLCAFDVVVTGASTDPAIIEGGRWKRRVVYLRKGGVAVIVGALETVGTDQSTDAGLEVTIDTDGADLVRVRVKSTVASGEVNWTARFTVQESLARQT